MFSYLLLIILWLTWCFLHSFLISPKVTIFFQRRLQDRYRFFRFLYNITALLTLIPVLLYGLTLAGPFVWRWEGPLRLVQGLVIISSLVLFIAGARRYDLWQFMGMRQMREENTCEVLTDDCRLDTSGVLGIVRHPWYTGGMLIVWARDLDVAGLLINLVLTGYFIIGAYLEERKLVMQFGQEYIGYQKRVPMFFPIKWVKDLFGS